MRPPSRRGADGLGIGGVAPLARAIDFLSERALVALHHVPPPAAGDDRGRERQRQPTRRRGQRRERQRMLGHTDLRRLAAGTGAMHVVAVRDERAHQPGRRTLHAPMKRIRASDDENSHDTVAAPSVWVAAAGPPGGPPPAAPGFSVIAAIPPRTPGPRPAPRRVPVAWPKRAGPP